MTLMIDWLNNRFGTLAKDVFTGIIAVILFFFPMSCSDQPETHRTTRTDPALAAKGFTFFDLSARTPLTDEIRETLKDNLGPDTYETRTTIDLEIRDKGFLAAHFPELHELNRQLNYLPGERVEHDSIQLTYRYARRKNSPFDFVRLIFSGDTRTPLHFTIRAKNEGAEVLKTIREKYGPADHLKWADGNGQSHYWKKDGDMLVISETRTRIGTPQYLFHFYFINNINSMLKKEQAQRARRKEALEKRGQTAF